MPFEERGDKVFSVMFRYAEKFVLLLVGGFSFGAIIQISINLLTGGVVHLADLLLIFIFVEIMAMSNVYFVRRSVPFSYPMFIAVTALSRLIVLQGKDIAPENLLYESGAILLVSISILIVRYCDRFNREDPRDAVVEAREKRVED